MVAAADSRLYQRDRVGHRLAAVLLALVLLAIPAAAQSGRSPYWGSSKAELALSRNLSADGTQFTFRPYTTAALPACAAGTDGTPYNDTTAHAVKVCLNGTIYTLATGSSGITIGSTTITSGTTTRVLYDNAGVVGEMTTSGSGTVLCLATGCALVTPSLGVATATSINGNTFTTGTYTLTGVAGKTFTFNNTITLAGTDSTTMTFPSTSATIARTDAANTFTGTQTLDTANVFRATPGTTGFHTITGTLTTSSGVTHPALYLNVTSAGSTANANEFQLALYGVLNAGYTGTGLTGGGYFENLAAGTATNPFSSAFSGVANAGVSGITYGTTAGTNIGLNGSGQLGNVNYGVFGKSTGTKNSATNIGVAGFAVNAGSSPVTVGGYFGLQATTPTYATAALIADNGAVAADILVARDNGTAVLTVADGGPITITSTLVSSRTTDFGWTVVTGANTACNTTCTSACVVGFDVGTLGAALAHIVLCTDATADECLCAGPS